MLQRRFRFTLRAILLLTAVVCVFLTLTVVPWQRQDAVRARISYLNGKSVLGAGTSIPAWMGPFGRPGVVAVDLSNAQVTSADICELTGLSTLSSLKLSGTPVIDDDVATLCRIPSLTSLNLASTPVTDGCCQLLAAMPQLESLVLRSCRIGDCGLERLSATPQLRSLDVRSTDITPEGITCLSSIRTLRGISLDDDCLTVETAARLAEIPDLVLQVNITRPGATQLYSLLQMANLRSHATIGPSDAEVWSVMTAWEDSTAGIVELVSGEANLGEEDAFVLLEVLAATKPYTGWVRRVERVRRPAPTPLQSGEPIESLEDFVRALTERKAPGPDVVAYARLLRPADLPRLRSMLGRPEVYRKNRTVCSYYATLLVTLGIADGEAMEELRRLFEEDDSSVRAVAMYGIRAGWRQLLGGDPDQRPSTTQRQAMFELLASLVEDPHWEVRASVAGALGESIALAGADAFPVLLKLVADPLPQVRNAAEFAIEQVARESPSIRRVALEALRTAAAGQADEILSTLQETSRSVARTDEQLSLEVAREALTTIANSPPSAALDVSQEDLASLAVWPVVVREVVPELLRLSRSADPETRHAARQILSGVAYTVRNRVVLEAGR